MGKQDFKDQMSPKKKINYFDISHLLTENIFNKYGVTCEDKTIYQVIAEMGVDYIVQIIRESSRIAKLRNKFNNETQSALETGEIPKLNQETPLTLIHREEDKKSVLMLEDIKASIVI